MDVQKLFADRVGGEKFGKVQQTFKFTLINNAKLDFIAKNPTVKVIDMGVGEPEEIPAQSIIDTLSREAAVKENRIYPCNGILEFCEAGSRYLEKLLGVKLDPKTELMHCIGTKAALTQIPLAFVNPGESVVATVPGYPVLPRVAEWLGAKMISLKLEPQNNYLPDRAEFESVIKQHKPKMVLLNYPNNPTGAVASLEFYKWIVGLAHTHSFVIVQDAAYVDFVFEGSPTSPLQVDGGKEVTLELFSLSKSYNMQGYRIGLVAGGAPLIKAFSLVKDNTDNGQFIAIQRAGIHALEGCGTFLAENREKYRRRLHRVAQILRDAGIEATPSPGTFYLYVAAPKGFRGHSFNSAQAFADFLIAQYGIITVPWEEAGSFIRFSMTFEVGTKDFKNEDEVFSALEARLLRNTLE